ncbi:hypothetical protein N0Y54_41895 [Nostoc punctiforme UO1]|uniref:hypothetical protein n=1 Tax=Nostoc punctiforme TaxID=272131 RepID=UPI0030AD920C
MDLEQANLWLRRIADCLHYPKYSHPIKDNVTNTIDTTNLSLTSLKVRCEMEELLQQFVPDPKQNPAQFALKKKLQRLWDKYGTNLLHCYDIPGLPPDNLKMEAMFSNLRRHQRRISGRKSTAELRDFGQYQVLFLAESEVGEAPRQQKHRLHRHSVRTIQALVDQHTELLTVLESQALEYQLDS